MNPHHVSAGSQTRNLSLTQTSQTDWLSPVRADARALFCFSYGTVYLPVLVVPVYALFSYIVLVYSSGSCFTLLSSHFVCTSLAGKRTADRQTLRAQIDRYIRYIWIVCSSFLILCSLSRSFICLRIQFLPRITTVDGWRTFFLSCLFSPSCFYVSSFFPFFKF